MSTKRPSMREGPLAELFRSTVSEDAPGDDRPPRPTSFDDGLRGNDQSSYIAVIKVVGVGGAGCNAVDRMIEAGIRDVDFVAINTDRQALERSEAPVRLAIGMEITGGLGTGGDAEKGAQAVRESEDHIRRALRGADLVFIAAGEGGGTGSGASPMVAKIAREIGALTLAVVTRPFAFEGNRRTTIAERGIEELQTHADTVITIPNDRLMTVLQRGTSMLDAFKLCDDLLRQGVQGICDMIMLPGLINLDFADVRTIIRGAGTALLGIGYAGGGNRAVEAAAAAISSPLLETPIDGARGILLGITGGPDLSLMEVNEAARVVADAADPNANIIFGATIDPDLGDAVWVTVVAANFSGVRSAPPRPMPKREDAPEEAPKSAQEAQTVLPPPPPLSAGTSRRTPPLPIPRAAPPRDEPPEAPDFSSSPRPKHDPPYPAAKPETTDEGAQTNMIRMDDGGDAA
jgi:cell division protein FtsZ